MDRSISTLTIPMSQGASHAGGSPRGRRLPITPASGAAPKTRRAGLPALLTRVRVLILAFAILAAGFAALAPQMAQEAGAVSPCTVSTSVKYSSSGYVWGAGASSCPYNVNQAIKVSFYGNGVWLGSRTVSGYNYFVAAKSPSFTAYCGVRYQTATTHYLNGYATTTWSAVRYLC